jgi:hypothetical protein
VKKLVALLALLALAGCSTLGIGPYVDPDAVTRWKAWTDAKIATDADPAHKAVNDQAGADARKVAESVGGQKSGTFDFFRLFADAVTTATAATPWGELGVAAGGLITGIGAILHSRKTRAEVNDPVAGAKRRARTKAVLGAVDAVAGAAAPPGPPTG